MKTKEIIQLDIHKPILLFRSLDDVDIESIKIDVDLESSSASAKTETIESKIIVPTKKKINIPICDFSTEQEYEAYVQPNFKIPSGFIRHAKKIGEEIDITMDYVIEDEDLNWIQQHPRLSKDKEVAAYLSVSSFEKIINTLEKYTGFALEPINKAQAEKIAVELLNWPTSVSTRVMPELYSYWLAKRERLQKPLLRKYWPQSSSTDTNPHHVFRPRDKDRYRLRKQHRKNDIDAFRRMQQLRGDFTHVNDLLKLVLERECLKEASLEIAHEMFERALPTSLAAIARRAEQTVRQAADADHPSAAAATLLAGVTGSSPSPTMLGGDAPQFVADTATSSFGAAGIGMGIGAMAGAATGGGGGYVTLRAGGTPSYRYRLRFPELVKSRSEVPHPFTLTASLLRRGVPAGSDPGKDPLSLAGGVGASSSGALPPATLGKPAPGVKANTTAMWSLPNSTGVGATSALGGAGAVGVGVGSTSLLSSALLAKSKKGDKKEKKAKKKALLAAGSLLGSVPGFDSIGGELSAAVIAAKAAAAAATTTTGNTGEESVANAAALAAAVSPPIPEVPAVKMFDPRLPGPRHYCGPLWPSFMHGSLPHRALPPVAPPETLKQYIADLEGEGLLHPTSLALLQGGTYEGISGVTVQKRKFGDWMNAYNNSNESSSDSSSNNNSSSTNNGLKLATSQPAYSLKRKRDQMTGDLDKHIAHSDDIQEPGTTTDGQANNSCNISNTESKYLHPKKIHRRARIGRGGRIVMDRFPIFAGSSEGGGPVQEERGDLHSPAYISSAYPYSRGSSFWTSDPMDVTHYHPTSLPAPIRQKTSALALGMEFFSSAHDAGQGTASFTHAAVSNAPHTASAVAVSGQGSSRGDGEVVGVGNSLAGESQRPPTPVSSAAVLSAAAGGKADDSNAGVAGTLSLSSSASSRRLLQRLPPVRPLSHAPLPRAAQAALESRLSSIYACSDSEDERIELPRRHFESQLHSQRMGFSGGVGFTAGASGGTGAPAGISHHKTQAGIGLGSIGTDGVHAKFRLKV